MKSFQLICLDRSYPKSYCGDGRKRMKMKDAIVIGLRWADVYELMKGVDQPPAVLPLENKYQNFTKRLEKMFAKEFPNKTIEIDWLD